MFEGYAKQVIATTEAEIALVRGGQGPPVLLLHGYPQTHAMWHKIAADLARAHTVVVADLRGYGDSSKPASGPEHAAYSKRAMGQDMIEVMETLGHRSFRVVGHDRGARVAYRMALDHPGAVERLAVLDIVPTLTVWHAMNSKTAFSFFHWLFLAQPDGLPEALIGQDSEYWLRELLQRWSADVTAFDDSAVREYLRWFKEPEAIHASCEDYRAGAGLDREHDEKDYGRRRIACPTLVVWGEQGIGRTSGDPLAVWREWADDVQGGPVPGGHFVAEEAPGETLALLRTFLG